MKYVFWLAALAIAGVRAETTYDLVVYGSSPAAVSAAVQAKRMGASCVVVSPETRIGGLTTGGLGQTDIGNKTAFGGIALEFYRAVAAWYRDEAHWTRQKRNDYMPDGQCSGTKGTDSMWTFEPSAARAILEGWEKRDGLEIVRGERLDRAPGGVTKAGARIVSFRTLSGKVFRGRMFVDATYEGDLMASAGVAYTLGREANAQYGETLSGCQRVQARNHQFVKGVSAYRVPGDPSSGLVAGVARDDGRPDGTGDRYVQAYCFRMCLTDVPENRIPFAKPADYDESLYELLFRQLAARPASYYTGDLTWKLPWINSKMPNRKTDTNNRDGFSTDFIGRNWNWPEASYDERAKIFAAHLSYQRGLMWTLANHPRVPEVVRRVYAQWGTCRDEFPDGAGDGWQDQLYVREARRMVGDYVMTEANCRGLRIAARPVAMGAYGMDSHHVRRLADAQGFVRNEGDVEVHRDAAGRIYGPYGIDYGALVPKRGEAANLFVPVCVSASHIAFGSIRMEPVFFALGQAAATAAVQANAAGCAVQDLPYAPLAARLKADGQVLALAGKTKTFALSPARAHPYGRGFQAVGDEIVVDNGEATDVMAGANWGLALNQKEALPFTITTRALCEKGPGGSPTRSFSLYIDLSYMDGGHLWGQVAEFAPDPKRGWKKGSVTLIPDKPVRVANVYCMYRNLPGRVRFQAPVVRIRDAKDLVLFDAQPIPVKNLPKAKPGFLVRDVRVEDDVYSPIAEGGVAKGLKLATHETPAPDGSVHVSVRVEETTGHDRAVTLVYAMPLPEGALVFEQDPRTSIPLAPTDTQRSDVNAMGCGAGGLNRWPFGAVSVGGRGFGLGVDTARPAFFRTVVHPRARLFFIAFDLGFAPEKRVAEFSFRRFGFTGGFRGALGAYAALEPEAFKTRVPEQGIWMPFRAIKGVEGWEDFGFKFKEGDGEVAWDDAHNIITFRYTEPSTWWMSMDRAHGTNVFTMADCVARAEALAAKGNLRAQVWKTSVMRDEDGARIGRLADAPWCRGALWILSPLPDIPGLCEYKEKNSEALFAKNYAATTPPAGLDGEYIDSAEGYLTPTLDFNREVFAASATPLMFSSDESHRPGVFKGLSMYEYVRRTAERVWKRGRYMMANGVPGRWPWLPAYVDVGGTETRWIDKDGNWRPEDHASLVYKRAMSMGKPYCYLQNVNFAKFKYEDMENFMRYCVAYGFFPGCFSHNASEGHYFSMPEAYNRDRPLFKKYVPLCKMLSEAGWRPVNELVESSDAHVFVEQFGDRYVTVFNAAKKPVKVRLTAKKGACTAMERVAGGKVVFDAAGAVQLALAQDAVAVLDFQ